ncbi:helix-turn-helix domain-containing protein [Intestinimonas massiliensis (ex Afouda et al. 2020)]|uniref:helix-turn-helix domain-containing protein n=1 Tax=Intestinimonas massiliensis (ex Afouda et al. 2020) TaxID=1673721 RepID=UPI001030277C|nr:helix-turn-helix transcriptional regulator [Intestinimonas massiliensis (ex Afouda et al. 2020)]
MRVEPLRYERIRNLRVDRDLTQQEVADVLHIKQNTYSQYETGTLNYPLEVVVTLARFYGTSVDYLLGLTDEMTPYPRRSGGPFVKNPD